jgi:hypothetical protein
MSNDSQNTDKIILDLCGGTGSWSKPYLESGYDVRLITLPENDVRHYIPPLNVYGILCAPPCTMFSLARTTPKKPRDFREGMEIVEACLRIIWDCQYQNKLHFWALENPTGMLRRFMGRPFYSFSPNNFGHNYTKKTDLWGVFNIPHGKPYELNNEEKARCSINNRILPSIPGITRNADKRSITPEKFARAFFNVNK